MVAALVAGLTSASLSVMGTILGKKVFEEIIRRLVVVILKKIVASTENTVDDHLVEPIIKELQKG